MYCFWLVGRYQLANCINIPATVFFDGTVFRICHDTLNAFATNFPSIFCDFNVDLSSSFNSLIIPYTLSLFNASDSDLDIEFSHWIYVLTFGCDDFPSFFVNNCNSFNRSRIKLFKLSIRNISIIVDTGRSPHGANV